MVKENLLTKLSYDASDNLIYIGKAVRNSIASNAVWQIRKLIYDASSNLTDIKWADGSDKYIKIWDDRTSYTYG